MELITKQDNRPVTALVISGVVLIALSAMGSYEISHSSVQPQASIIVEK